MNRSDNKIPVLSFFTGGGFLDIGFEKAGFDIVWTNEIDTVFAKFYESGMTFLNKHSGNKGEFKISNTSSIKDINPHIIISEAFNGNKPGTFGVIGGPPCQDFSLNGNLHGFKGDRGSLTDCFLYKILELQPAFFVMENVLGLLKVKKNLNHFLELLTIMKQYYYVDFDILNSIDFGVPQFRERVFVIGLNKTKYILEDQRELLGVKWFPFPKNELYFDSAKKHNWPGPISFGKNPVKDTSIPIELCIQSCLVSQEEEAEIPNANEYFKLHGDKRVLSGIKEGETNRPSFKRLHRYKFSPTACYGNNEVHLHPYQHRRLSVREALRIQGVPDCYVLPEGQLTKKFKMIGNGVPVPLAYAVARSVFKFLSNLPKGKINNGYLVKKEEERSDVKNPVKEYKAGKNAKVFFT